MNTGRKDRKQKVVYHVPEPGERKLWPSDEYRSEGQCLGDEVIRALWPSDEYRPDDQQADMFVERLLWPSDEYRPPDQQPGTQVIRRLWTYPKEPEQNAQGKVRPVTVH